MALERIGKYQNLVKIGEGAMGIVYKAHDPILNRDVAIKTMSSAVGSDEDLKKRFKIEAQSAGRLNHPNIITVYDFGEDQEVNFIAMEYLDGKDLRSVIGDRSVTLEEKLHVMEQIADGLAFAHAMGVVHRDLKPANIHVLPSGKVKIMDFGLARFGSSDMTKTGMVMGTPNYMSPEQVRGEKVDVRSDIFSIGAVFYEILTIHKPFQADSMHAVLFQVLENDPEPPRRWVPTLPPVLVQLVERALRKEPARRFANGGDLLEAILDARQTIDPELLATALPLMDPTGETILSDGSGPDLPQTGVTAAKKSRWTSVRPRSSNAASDPGSRAIPRPALSNTVLGSAPTQMEGVHSPRARRPAAGTPSTSPWPYLVGGGLVVAGGALGWILTHRTDPSRPVDVVAASQRPPSPIEAGPSLAPPTSVPEPSPSESRTPAPTAPPTEKPRRSPNPPASTRPSERPSTAPATFPTPLPATPTPLPTPFPTPVPVTLPPATPPPVPVSTVPPTTAPAPVNEEPAIRRVVAEYGRSIEEKDLALFKSLKPNITAEEEKRLKTAFQGGGTQTVRISVLNVQITGARAIVHVSRQDAIDGHVQTVQQTLHMAKGSGGWTILEIGR